MTRAGKEDLFFVLVLLSCLALIIGIAELPPGLPGPASDESVLAQLLTRATAHAYTTVRTEVPEDDRFYWPAKRLEGIIEADLGAHIDYAEPPIEGAIGATFVQQRRILIEPTLHWTARFETLAHEAGHLLQPSLQLTADKEVFAEAVSCVVASWDGDAHAVERSSYYLVGMKGSLHILTDYRGEILRAARILEGR